MHTALGLVSAKGNMRNHNPPTAAFGGCPEGFRLEKGIVERCATLQDRKLVARQSRHTITADASDSRRRSGPQGRKYGSCKGGETRYYVVSKSSVPDELRQVGHVA